MTDLERLEQLKNKIFEQSNEHCFVERERFLATYPTETMDSADYYARLLSDMLDSVSTPIDACDIILGRVIEGEPDSRENCPNRLIFAKGHLCPDYAKLLRLGYRGILDEIQENAARIGTEKARNYAKNAEIVIHAIDRYAKRYAEAAKQAGRQAAYEALSRVPFEPAYDLFSALQSIWLVHMVASCYMGSRDYAFGYMDEYLYPFYKQEKEKDTSNEEIRNLLAGFLIKPNEICGRHPHNHRQKPVLSQASKQYVLLDGGRANELSIEILEAGKINLTAQPIYTVMLDENASPAFTAAVFESMTVLTDKMQVFNASQMKGFLEKKGLPVDICNHPAVSACCTFDIERHAIREEFYLPTVAVFTKTLFENTFDTLDDFLAAFSRGITAECQQYIDETHAPDYDFVRKAFLLDALLLEGCNEACEYPPYALKYRAKNIFLPGIATLGDSLAALDTLVFRGDVAYSTFADALKQDFVGYDELYERACACQKFGNDADEDRYTVQMANLLIDAVEAATHAENEIIAPSFYSLERENVWGPELPATPDGRHAGCPFSENQSASYGADRSGITALLNSLAKLPFDRTAAGGLNLTFSSNQRPEILQALVKTYFAGGGKHVGISVIDRNTLLDAMEHPEKYRSLTVRLYGFSEYFITLPEWQKLAVLNRTAY